MSSYEVGVGAKTMPVETFREAGHVVMEAVTGLLAQDPEVAESAMMANREFSSGAVEHAVDDHGSWSMCVTVHGEPVTVAIVKVDQRPSGGAAG